MKPSNTASLWALIFISYFCLTRSFSNSAPPAIRRVVNLPSRRPSTNSLVRNPINWSLPDACGRYRSAEREHVLAVTRLLSSSKDEMNGVDAIDIVSVERTKPSVIDAITSSVDTDGFVVSGASLVAATTTTTSSDASLLLDPPSDWLPLWKRRLITSEDPFSVHKLASIIYTLSGFGILGAAAYQYATGSFDVIPDWLEAPTHIYLVSNAIMCLFSVRMAFVHRRFDLTARNGFLGVASASLFSCFFMEWVSPFAAADVFNNIWISRACFALFVLLNTYFITDTVSKTAEVVESRRDKKASDYDGRALVDSVLYVQLPIASGLPPLLLTAYIESVLHDRLWFQSQCQHIVETTGIAFPAHPFYLMVTLSMAASQGALFVTLRDKKLISKTAEWVGITVFSLPAFAWTAFVGFVFLGSMIGVNK